MVLPRSPPPPGKMAFGRLYSEMSGPHRTTFSPYTLPGNMLTENLAHNRISSFYHNEHSGGCPRQPSTPAEGGRRAKLVCRYRVYHLSEAIKLKTQRPPAGFLVLQSHHSYTCKLWGTSAFSSLGFNGWFTFQFFHAVFCSQ